MTTTSAAGAPPDRLRNSAEAPTTTERTAMTTPDITGAIANARDVYESVPNAGQVLDYLQAVLQADAEAQAANDWRESALKAEAALAARGTKEGFMTGTGHGPAPEGLVGGSSWTISEQANNAIFDQAGGNMAAESAQMAAAAEGMAARAGHVGSADPLQTRIDAAVGGGLLDDLKGFIEEVNAGAAAWAMPAPTPVPDLVLTIDTSAIDAALAKVEQLKAALASVLPARVSHAVAKVTDPVGG
jgi:hypothetical protein